MECKIALIDICGTLFHSNTTFDFLDFMFLYNKKYRFYKKITNTYSWKLLNKLLYIFFRIDTTRKIAIHFLRNVKEEELHYNMALFSKDWLSSREIATTKSIIASLQATNCRIILVSATLDFIAHSIGNQMGLFEAFSSKLIYESGICKGKLSEDVFGRKLQVCIQNDVLPPYEMVMTDNFSDIDIIAEAKFSYIISSTKNVPRWRHLLNRKKISQYELICHED